MQAVPNLGCLLSAPTNNLQGDVLGLLDSNNNEVVQYTYDAWGKVLFATGTLASTLGTVQPFRYRGYVYDVETELYYLRSRYYNPKYGRFINADIIFGALDEINNSNLYLYCENLPTVLSDYDGFVWVRGAYAPFYGFYHLQVVLWIVQNNPNMEMERNTSTGRIDLRNKITTEIYEVKIWNEAHISAGLNQLRRYINGDLPAKFGYSMLVLPADGELHYEYPNTTVDVIVRQHGPLITYRLKVSRKQKQKEYERVYQPAESPVHYKVEETSNDTAIKYIGLFFIFVVTLIDPIPGDEAAAFAALLALP